jgi:uncharacterized integral membrane protein (TIGR00697 family)
MIDHFIEYCICVLSGYPSELASFLTFCVCAGAIVCATRGGYYALCAYNVLAVVLANIQVLRAGVYFTTPEPVALGTVLFATTYLVSDLITEHYGTKAAYRAVRLTFWAQILVCVWMVLCLAHPTFSHDAYQNTVDTSMRILFIPSTRILIASLTSFLISQSLDIYIFQWIRRCFNGHYLWLRQNIAMCISGLFDNFLFSVMAWRVLNPEPLSWRTLMITYVLSGYSVRFCVNILGTPLMYIRKNRSI